jgi:hypothetical protein
MDQLLLTLVERPVLTHRAVKYINQNEKGVTFIKVNFL